jgi:RNA polymerase sigma-70 factor (ECF subfamily)
MTRDPANSQTQLGRGEFEAFYRQNYGAVSRYVARRIPLNAHDEVVAATFVIAWKKFTTVSTPSLPWLYRIANYEVAHERRRLSRHPQVAELNDIELAATHPLEDVIDLSRAFSKLSESDAELLRLVHWEQLTRTEIAGVLGASVNAINVRYHRAVERLGLALASSSTSAGDASIVINPTINKETE